MEPAPLGEGFCVWKSGYYLQFILIIYFADHRASLIKHNRLSVVAMLSELPTTTHDLSTFVIDVNFALVSQLYSFYFP